MARLPRALHRIAFWAADHRMDWLAALIYRVVCPYPIDGNWSSAACRLSGNCGCDNRRPR